MNIIKFLEDHDIYYTTEGHNTKRGNVSVKCPMCGDADKSEHMGIVIQTPHKWGCLRNDKHRGKNIVDLIVALTNYSWAEAKQLAEADKPQLEGLSASDSIKDIFSKKEVVEEAQGVDYLEFPKEFNTVRHMGVYRKFHSYLWERGFEFHDIKGLVNYYDLRGCLIGPYAYRLIIPVFFEQKLVSWTGRIIGGSESLRYMDLPPSESVIPLKETLLDYDTLLENGGRRLYLVEGAFDCFPISLWSDAEIGVTCSFTVNLSSRQKHLLKLLSEKFDEIVILPDRSFEIKAYELKQDLAYLKNIYIQILPDDIEDPGKLQKTDVVKLICENVKN